MNLDGDSGQRVLRAGDALYSALRDRTTLTPLTTTYPDLTLDDAYRISRRFLERRVARGEKVVGKKIGVTSKAVQEMLHVHQPDFGFLTDAMQYKNGSRVSLRESGLIQPRAEGEIAFVLNRSLCGPGVTRDDVLSATDHVVACFEIVDSRIDNWRIRIEDTVADNASCGIFVLGETISAPDSCDLAAASMELHRNGVCAAVGRGSAVQGHPAEAVAWLANTLGTFGVELEPGDIILSGSLGPLVPVAAGDTFHLHITGLGSAMVSFVE